MKILAFDIEATDLMLPDNAPLDKQPHIFEYGSSTATVNKYQTLKISKTEILIKPPIRIPEKIEAITKVTNDMVRDSSPLSFHADKIKQEIESADVVVAHNMGYDYSALNANFKRLGLEIKWPKIFCTVEIIESLYGYRANLKYALELICGRKHKDHHRAYPDADACLDIFIKLLKDGKLNATL